jgi:DNA polymerase-4
MPRLIAFLKLTGFPAAAAETFWEQCARLTPRVEPLAEHEAFLDLTGLPGLPELGNSPPTRVLPPVLQGLADDLRRTLGAAEELELRVGLATNRLVARLAAEQLDREGCLTVAPGAESAFLAPLSPAALWPIPASARQILRQLGLSTLAEVRAVPEPALRRLLGPEAFLLLRHAWGRDNSPVPLLTQARSARAKAFSQRLEQRINFPAPVEWPEAAALLQKAALDLAAQAREGRRGCWRLRLSLELATGERRVTRHTPPQPLRTPEEFVEALTGAAGRLLAKAGASAAPRRLTLQAEVTEDEATQLALLPALPASPALSAEALDRVMAAVNRACAKEALFPAARLASPRRERFRQLLLGGGHAAP